MEGGRTGRAGDWMLVLWASMVSMCCLSELTPLCMRTHSRALPRFTLHSCKAFASAYPADMCLLLSVLALCMVGQPKPAPALLPYPGGLTMHAAELDKQATVLRFYHINSPPPLSIGLFYIQNNSNGTFTGEPPPPHAASASCHSHRTQLHLTQT